MLVRIANWQSALSEYLLRAARTPFRYGVQDCGLFVAGAIEAMTGIDVVADLRGYSNRREAFARIEALCGSPTMEAAAIFLAARSGIEEVPVLRAQRGDAMMLRGGRRSSLGVVAMHGTEILTPYRDGLLRLPLSHARRVWHI